MDNIAIFGTQWGDEGKARCINTLSKDFLFGTRFSGGSNAGHTLFHNGKKIVRHLIPSIDFSQPKIQAFLASGMVINLEILLREVKETEEIFPGAAKRIIVDPDAFVVLPQHITEDKEKNAHFGSTNQGITPAYRDKVGRIGTKIRKLIEDKADIIQALQKLGVQFKYILELKEMIERVPILFEGSQSILLDLHFGNYPFITSGECGLGGIYNAGFAFAPPTKVYGIAKPYLTKSGVGHFLTELSEDEANKIRDIAKDEIGGTTGRVRRIGALDLPALKYSVIKGGITHLILTKLDIMNGQDKIKVCYDYGISVFSGNDFEKAKPYYVDLPGWKDARDPAQIKPFLNKIEEYIGIPIDYVSVGVNDEDMLKVSSFRNNIPTIFEPKVIVSLSMQETKELGREGIRNQIAVREQFKTNGVQSDTCNNRLTDPFDNNVDKYCLCACDKCAPHGDHSCGKPACSANKDAPQKINDGWDNRGGRPINPNPIYNVWNDPPKIKSPRYEVFYVDSKEILGEIDAIGAEEALALAQKYFGCGSVSEDAFLAVRPKKDKVAN